MPHLLLGEQILGLMGGRLVGTALL